MNISWKLALALPRRRDHKVDDPRNPGLRGATSCFTSTLATTNDSNEPLPSS
jgi:hypothetical protein